MAVYVDDAQQRIGPWRCCRMVADTAAELRAMAEAIDVAPRWERVIDGVPGFRLTALRRRWAVAHGAIAVDTAALDRWLAGRRRLAAVGLRDQADRVRTYPYDGPEAGDSPPRTPCGAHGSSASELLRPEKG